ncbi:hypothetical protein GA0061078_0681 [Bifidobacterium bohemicum]|uniref:Uncharacterized protein n=1 Tax=Bifidobacterium bohemicum DSM 22767 TaxID=1437606 RepID=A0A086ZK75_9BIFI|nr:hypothetical protein [Bifidobacterium bohemicum]KFI46925.1 hypothetical protein BBOH_0399 [Bifidobacterium bohemicum DSM 22767]SCB85220.1 hypothetical protein GA0061078_0681 [Bifidobacterium bohemicum]
MSTDEVTAIATRSGAWWAVEVPQRPDLFTQVRRLSQVEPMVHDAARTLGQPVDAVHVTIRLATTEDDNMVERLYKARDEAKTAQNKASALTRQTITKLRGQGLKLADIAQIVGLTTQRVSELQRS